MVSGSGIVDLPPEANGCSERKQFWEGLCGAQSLVEFSAPVHVLCSLCTIRLNGTKPDLGSDHGQNYIFWRKAFKNSRSCHDYNSKQDKTRKTSLNKSLNDYRVHMKMSSQIKWASYLISNSQDVRFDTRTLLAAALAVALAAALAAATLYDCVVHSDIVL